MYYSFLITLTFVATCNSKKCNGYNNRLAKKYQVLYRKHVLK